MYQHILLPTDGSPASAAAIQSALQFARDAGARVTALHVLPEFHTFTLQAAQLEDTYDSYMRETSEHAAAMLNVLAGKARAMGLRCETVVHRSDQPHRKIVDTAQTHGCDLIIMATHGLTGLKGMVLGSQTHKVLLESSVPVLVFNAGKTEH